ncbi:SDR family NAD(P)-dependent oxidoreductase [Paractinoplanes lichenicola]|uniref:SDR family oxidoreductase n=1 Tax=Paractinoplanes lichenicola TaxID=2802976 RepID=A0ABS1VYI2_9ACTN|nr:SDR family oxidoreductase [Actinoplanes lichenicola]MBL7259556.1 SDR family oxidoreductase [Actinoplanes lichenicola]
MQFTGQTALITGASSGIGAAYAKEFAARGANLVLVARGEEVMHRLAEEIRSEYGRKVEVIASDLGVPGAAERLGGQVEELGLAIDVLVNNAGFGLHGDLVDADPARLTTMVQLNCVALVDLTRRLLPGMVTRRRGTVINVASTAAYQPVPHLAVYAATKAFVLSFTEALHAEVKPSGVRVLAISPGATQTQFFEVAGEQAAFGRRRNVRQVVASTMQALDRGRPSRIDGMLNAVVANSSRFAPRRMVLAMGNRTFGG